MISGISNWSMEWSLSSLLYFLISFFSNTVATPDIYLIMRLLPGRGVNMFDMWIWVSVYVVILHFGSAIACALICSSRRKRQHEV